MSRRTDKPAPAHYGPAEIAAGAPAAAEQATRAAHPAAPVHDAKRLFVAVQNIDGISQECATAISALVHAARKLVHCNADSLIALDGLLALIEDRADLWAGLVESDAEEVGAHEKDGPHIRLLVRLHNEQRAIKEGGAA